MELKDQINQKANEMFKDLVEIRNHLHSNPELSYEEYNTSAYIKNLLNDWGVHYEGDWAETGIIAKVEGKNSKKLIALRTDMDALPITEENEVTYKSKNKGVMHACGHDVHMTCLLGAIKILKSLEDYIECDLWFIFQPGEEKLPGGAKMLLDQGLFLKRKPNFILGQHVYNVLEHGHVGLRSGKYMASADEIYISVNGEGGHAAMPHLNKDCVVATCALIGSLQQIVSRNSNPLINSVLSFGKINTIGGATNVMPKKVEIEGTFRTMDEKWRKEAHGLIESICEGNAKTYGVKCELNIVKGYPCLYNDEHVTEMVEKSMINYLGYEHVHTIDQRMTSEDFAYYTQEIPGCFYRLGIANVQKGINAPVHNSKFDIDEKALITGSGMLAWLAFDLGNNLK